MFCPCRLDLLAQTLTWRHLAPTAPDTLTCYPFADDDPFVMQQCPHVMFAGNQPQYETRMMEGGWRTVCVGWEDGVWTCGGQGREKARCMCALGGGQQSTPQHARTHQLQQPY